jgi:anti-sigma factor RsiW
VTKVSACVDCGTTVIGERPRCPACHDRHAAVMADDIVTAPQPRLDVDVTTPRPRRITRGRRPSFVVAWLVGIEVTVIAALGVGLLVKGCLS